MPAVKIALLMFAAVGYAGAGVALAVGRLRELQEGEIDLGMRAVALVLIAFGAICTIPAAGATGVVAYGAVIGWFSYVVCANRVGVFTLETGAASRSDSLAEFNR